jgi:hypothetical protein
MSLVVEGARENGGEEEERGSLEVVVEEESIFHSTHHRWRPSPSLERGGLYISLLSQGRCKSSPMTCGGR